MQLVTETPWTVALPAPQWTAFNQPGVWLTAIGLATAQIPLTFGNVILGIVAETRRLFSAVNVDESRMAHSTGFMNLLAGGLGAPPMCFGAGGIDAVRRVQLSLGDIVRLAATSLGAAVYRATKWRDRLPGIPHTAAFLGARHVAERPGDRRRPSSDAVHA